MSEGASEGISKRETRVEINTLWLLRHDIGKIDCSHCESGGLEITMMVMVMVKRLRSENEIVVHRQSCLITPCSFKGELAGFF